MSQHHFDIDHAIEFGVEAAIVINNFQFWIETNRANGRNYYDGKTWTFNSVKALCKLFPYWTKKQMRRIIDNLEERDVLVSGNYNEKAYDKTKWYAFVDEKRFLKPIAQTGKGHCPNGQREQQNPLPKRAKAIAQTGKPIPDNNLPDNNLPERENARSEKPKIEVDYNAAKAEIIAYLKENQSIAIDRMKRAGIPLDTAGKKKALACLSGYLNKLAREGEFFRLTPPKSDGDRYTWIGRHLAGWESYMRSWVNNERKEQRLDDPVETQKKADFTLPVRRTAEQLKKRAI